MTTIMDSDFRHVFVFINSIILSMIYDCSHTNGLALGLIFGINISIMPICSYTFNLFGEYKKKTVTKNEVIREFDSQHFIFLVIKGTIKTYKEQNEGRFIVNISNTGDLMGLSSMFFSDSANYLYQAITATEVVEIPVENFSTLLRTDPKFMIDILKYMSEKNDELELRISNINGKKAWLNFVRLLHRLDEMKLKNIVPDILSTQDVADLIGTTPNYVYKIIQKFEDKLLISFKNRKLNVINRELLRKILFNQVKVSL
jgi:CRP-like cAMP-binding protein